VEQPLKLASAFALLNGRCARWQRDKLLVACAEMWLSHVRFSWLSGLTGERKMRFAVSR